MKGDFRSGERNKGGNRAVKLKRIAERLSATRATPPNPGGEIGRELSGNKNRPVEFTVYGTPRPQGSMKTIPHRQTGAMISMPDNPKTKPWRQEIAHMALLNRVPLISGPVVIRLQFFFAKPKSRPKSWLEPACKPDLDKLSRACFDALKGICYNDDAQVVALAAEKAYGLPERVEIMVGEISEFRQKSDSPPVVALAQDPKPKARNLS